MYGRSVAGSRRRYAAWILALCLLWPGGSAWAATEYSVIDGLSQNSVLALARDDDGFLWIGTEDGLNRFDGYEFQVFRPDPDQPLGAAAAYIRALLADGRYLYLGTNGGGLGIFDRDSRRFRLLGLADGLPAEHLNTLALAAPGSLYVGSRNGLFRLDWQGDPMQAAIQVSRVELGTPGNPRHADVWDLHLGPSGLWIATGDGVFRRDGQGRVHALAVPGALAPFNSDALLESPAGLLWIGTWSQGLFRVDTVSGEVRSYAPGDARARGLRSARVLSLAAGPGGVVYAGSDRGLAWLDPACDCLKAIEHRRSARVEGRGFVLLALQPDDSGGVFAGFWGEGLVRYSASDRVFHVERSRDDGLPSLRHNRVRALLEDRKGRLWVGSFGGGVQRAEAGRVEGLPWSFESQPFPEGSPEAARLVWSLIEDRRGLVWAGTDDGVYWRDGQNGAWQREAAPGHAVDMPGIRSLLEDRRGRIWVASSGGLGRIDAPGQARRRFATADEHGEASFRRQDESLYGLLQDADGHLWVGSSGGLHILDEDGQVLARYRARHGLPGPIVWGIHRHLDGSIWLATSGGLARVDGLAEGIGSLRFDNVSRRVGLPGGGVYGIVADRSGQLWLTGNRGLVRFRPEDSSFRVWSQGDGIASDEFTLNAVLQGANGWLYFGGIDGLTAFDPARLPERLEMPRPSIASIEMGGQELTLPSGAGVRRALRLAHDHTPLIVDVTGLVYDAPTALRYAYRLHGEESFTELGSRRSLILDHLAHGPHSLELRVSNRGVVATRMLLDIEVVPPLSATWPFRLGMVFLGALLLGLAYLWRVRELTRQRRKLEARVARRTRELRAQKEALEATAEALVAANDRLKSLSMVDTLTGLPNRRALTQQAESCLQLPADAGVLALALIDLDHFKRINDGYGHQAGDQVLRDFASVAALDIPPGGVVGRWGGEEFLVLLPDSDGPSARAWAERLLHRLRMRSVRDNGREISYRASIGIALAREGEGIDALLARADHAMYEAKAAGRDRVMVEDQKSAAG